MQNSLFGLANRYASLTEAGDPLERLNAVIDWDLNYRAMFPMHAPSGRSANRSRHTTYRSGEQEQRLKDSQHESLIHDRAYRNKPLTEAQELSNTGTSRIRARIEQVFGSMQNEMGGIFLRAIGVARARVGLMNLTYNLKHAGWILID